MIARTMALVTASFIIVGCANKTSNDSAYLDSQCSLLKDKFTNLIITEIPEHDLQIIDAYTKFKVAERNYLHWSSASVKVSTEYADTAVSHEFTKKESYWLTKQHKELFEVKKLIHKRELKTERMLELRSLVERCEEMSKDS